MALDSALVMKLTDSMRDFANELGKLREAAGEQSTLLEQVRDELITLNEGLSGEDAGDDVDDAEDDTDDEHDQEGKTDEDSFPDWVPSDVRAAITKHRSNPAFWLDMLSKIRNFAPAKNEAR